VEGAVEKVFGGDKVSTGPEGFGERAEWAFTLVKYGSKNTKANDNVELALAA